MVESYEILTLLIGLSVAITLVICLFAFFREDKDEQITPLCPQMIVKENDFTFKLPLEDSKPDSLTVLDYSDKPINQVVFDYADASRPGSSGVVATVRLQDLNEVTLASVVAREKAASGQALALCRAGCDIFGFVEPEGGNLYHVRHRTGVHLLTLSGKFDTWDIEATNAVGLKVCVFTKVDGELRGYVHHQIDAGLVICSLLAMYVHQMLASPVGSEDNNGSGPPTPTMLEEGHGGR